MGIVYRLEIDPCFPCHIQIETENTDPKPSALNAQTQWDSPITEINVEFKPHNLSPPKGQKREQGNLLTNQSLRLRRSKNATVTRVKARTRIGTLRLGDVHTLVS